MFFYCMLYAVPYFLNARMFKVWHDLINFRHCIQGKYKNSRRLETLNFANRKS